MATKNFINILDKSKHYIKSGTSLKLNNRIFPYPPNTHYKWICSPNILISEEQHYSPFTQEGGSTTETVIFTCNSKGKYNIEIQLLREGYYDEVIKTTTIEIICED